MLKDKKIVLGVTGSIAAYKSVELVRRIREHQGEVKVVMTKSATQFVHPLTFETLSGNQVSTELFPAIKKVEIEHVSLADWADVLLISPATANIIGKLACGIADDLLTTIALTMSNPIFIAPAMNENMWRNPCVTANISKLKQWGYKFIEPEYGELACGKIGSGRLASVDTILRVLTDFWRQSQDMLGKTVIVTAGRTEEPIDPVRYLSNRSSGKMGFALAQVAKQHGAEVILIAGRTSVSPPNGVQFLQVRTAKEMRDAVLQQLPKADIVIKSAGVADYRPVQFSTQKIKKSADRLTIVFEPTPDILTEIAKCKRTNTIVVGFAVETEDGIKNAQKKLVEKQLDLIVLNNPQVKGAGFETDTNVATLIYRDGKIEEFPLMSKLELAEKIIQRVVKLST